MIAFIKRYVERKRAEADAEWGKVFTKSSTSPQPLSPPVRTVGNLDDWSALVTVGERFRTHDGYFFTRLLCGHFRNEQTTDDPKKERSPQWCYMGCHER